MRLLERLADVRGAPAWASDTGALQRCPQTKGCGWLYGLEWDHVDPVANGGATSLENLKPRCPPHHRDKTERDRRAGLLGPAAAPGEVPP